MMITSKYIFLNFYIAVKYFLKNIRRNVEILEKKINYYYLMY